jgi:hypothetical protein
MGLHRLSDVQRELELIRRDWGDVPLRWDGTVAWGGCAIPSGPLRFDSPAIDSMLDTLRELRPMLVETLRHELETCPPGKLTNGELEGIVGNLLAVIQGWSESRRES